jgi:hypothetical protein
VRFALVLLLLSARAYATPQTIRCDNVATSDLSIDGLLDDWKQDEVLARTGAVPDGMVSLRCSWDGSALAIALDIVDDRLVRVASGKGHEDHVDITVAAQGSAKPVAITAYPGNSMAKARIAAPGRVKVADSLQPKGFSIEARVPASAIPGFGAATPALDVKVVFHDSDAATGGADHDLDLPLSIELGDRKDLLDDFLKTVRLKKNDVKVDLLADLDPDRHGKERLVAGGTVIGVLTDQFAYVALPAAKPVDVHAVTLLPFGPRGAQIVSAVVRQSGNGGSRDLLMLWTVWSGQLQPLGQIEVRKEQGANVLECEWKIEKGKKGPELHVTSKPAVGWSKDTWNEAPADDADSILLPWDSARSGIAYTLTGKELARRDLPVSRGPRARPR